MHTCSTGVSASRRRFHAVYTSGFCSSSLPASVTDSASVRPAARRRRTSSHSRPKSESWCGGGVCGWAASARLAASTDARVVALAPPCRSRTRCCAARAFSGSSGTPLGCRGRPCIATQIDDGDRRTIDRGTVRRAWPTNARYGTRVHGAGTAPRHVSARGSDCSGRGWVDRRLTPGCNRRKQTRFTLVGPRPASFRTQCARSARGRCGLQ